MVSASQPIKSSPTDEDGFLCPVPVFSTEEIAAIRSDFEAVEAKAGRTIGEMPGFVRAKTHLLYPWMDALVRHSRLLDVVEGLVGGNILVYHLTCWVKEPGDGRFVSWHQDGTYFSLEPYEHVTAWIPLSPATVETGCMMAIPGSHTIGQRDHTTEKSDRNLLSNGQTIAARIDEDKAVPLEVPVGSISLHHTHLVHASNPNRGSDRRIGIGVSYIPDPCAIHWRGACRREPRAAKTRSATSTMIRLHSKMLSRRPRPFTKRPSAGSSRAMAPGERTPPDTEAGAGSHHERCAGDGPLLGRLEGGGDGVGHGRRGAVGASARPALDRCADLDPAQRRAWLLHPLLSMWMARSWRRRGCSVLRSPARC